MARAPSKFAMRLREGGKEQKPEEGGATEKGADPKSTPAPGPVAIDTEEPIKSSGQSLANSGSVPNETQLAIRPGRDRSAEFIDIRKLILGEQIRLLVEEHPEAYSDESIQRLASTIKGKNDDKLEQPIVVAREDDGDHLVEGERRRRACIWLAEVEDDENFYIQPAKIRSPEEGEDLLFRQFVLNNTKEPVSLKTEAHLFKIKVEQDGWDQRKLAQEAGYTESRVSRILGIFKHPESIQELIWSGELPYTGDRLKKAVKEYRVQQKHQAQEKESDQSGSELSRGSLDDYRNKSHGPVTTLIPEEELDPIHDEHPPTETQPGSVGEEFLSAPELGEGRAPSGDGYTKPESDHKQTSAPKAPIVPKTKKTVSMDFEVAGSLYRIMRLVEGLHCETVQLDLDAIDGELPDRKALISELKRADEVLNLLADVALERGADSEEGNQE